MASKKKKAAKKDSKPPKKIEKPQKVKVKQLEKPELPKVTSSSDLKPCVHHEKSFPSVIREIKFTLNDIFFFEHLFGTVILFLFLTLATSIFGLPFWVSIVLAITYLVLRIVQRLRENKIVDIENAYPSLREKLRTAADTKDDDDNPIIKQLQSEICSELKNVKLSSFVTIHKISLLVILSIALSFAVIFLPMSGINFNNLHYTNLIKTVSENIPEIKAYDFIKKLGFGDKDDVPMGDEDIFGEESLIMLGDNELSFEMRPVSFEVDAPKVEDEKNYDSLIFDTAEGLDDSTYSLSTEKQELVKRYFNELNKNS